MKLTSGHTVLEIVIFISAMPNRNDVIYLNINQTNVTVEIIGKTDKHSKVGCLEVCNFILISNRKTVPVIRMRYEWTQTGGSGAANI